MAAKEFRGYKRRIMPELPEVEIQVRQLARRLRGARIDSLEVRDSKIKLPRSVVGQCIDRVHRRGKYIVFDLSGGAHLLAHLRMTGWFEFVKPSTYRMALHTSKTSVYFEDRRRLGHVQLVSPSELYGILGTLGPEPLGRRFSMCRGFGSLRSIKIVLLDQKVVAGIGNIYASESLWRARIHPRRPANRLQHDELKRLERAIGVTLRKAIRLGDEIFSVDNRFAVYGRQGEPCRRCRTPVRRMIQAQRSTFFCPKCQG